MLAKKLIDANRTLKTVACAALIAMAVPACRSISDNPAPEKVTATWFGVTNYHYQIGDVSFFQDGMVSRYAGDLTPQAAVDKVWEVLQKGGATPPTHIFIGHDHVQDHSADTPLWAAKFPAAQIVGPKTQCQRLADLKVANECITLTPELSHGRYAFRLGPFVEIRPVRWLHSSHSGCGAGSPAQAATPTFGFLIKVQTPSGPLAIYANDSGTGEKLDKDVIEDGLNFGTPLTNLRTAMADAHLRQLDLWQGGSETRVLRQARYIVPEWHPKAFQPQHWGEDNLFQGIPYDYFPGPTFTQFLADNAVHVVKQQNYFDAIEVDRAGTRRVANDEVKAAAGLPAKGPGPRALVPHPRLATQPTGECAAD